MYAGILTKSEGWKAIKNWFYPKKLSIGVDSNSGYGHSGIIRPHDTIKEAEKLKSREMKDEGWRLKDEWWKLKDEGWKIKEECWKMKD